MATTKRRAKTRPVDSPWFTVQEAADYLRVSVDTIYEACAKKGLPSSKLGHSTVRLHREQIDRWMETQTAAP